MKIEKRGKYPGVKVHLEPEECQQLMKEADVAPDVPVGKTFTLSPAMLLTLKLGKKLNALMKAEPDTLTERTPEQVAEVVALELETATQKMKALKAGKDWKGFTKAEVHHHAG